MQLKITCINRCRLLGVNYEAARSKKRNLPLAKYVYVKYAFYWRNVGDLTEYQGKRGRKGEGAVPVKFIMKMLNCNRRVAIDYRNALLADEKGDALWDICLKPLVKLRKEQKVSAVLKERGTR
jgi:hypothetical protein